MYARCILTALERKLCCWLTRALHCTVSDDLAFFLFIRTVATICLSGVVFCHLSFVGIVDSPKLHGETNGSSGARGVFWPTSQTGYFELALNCVGLCSGNDAAMNRYRRTGYAVIHTGTLELYSYSSSAI